jgi:hypothetical protein
LINDDQFTSSNVKTEEISKNIIWNKWYIFDPFVKFFTNNPGSYIPNKFIPTKFEGKVPDSFNLVEYIFSHHYYIIESCTRHYIEDNTELVNLIKQYQDFNRKIL